MNPAGFINTDNITIQELIGKKVILIDFWTYSCINCQRTFPYVTSWYEKYKDQGLEVIGIHTPEVDFGVKRSLEIYFGAKRNERFTNGMIGKTGMQILTEPTNVITDKLYLVGEWDIAEEYSKNIGDNDKIIFKYQAQKAFLVAGSESPVDIDVYQDGEFLKTVTIERNTLYRLIEDEENGVHTMELIIKGSGVEVYTFTFG